jgi:hypothetical protein
LPFGPRLHALAETYPAKALRHLNLLLRDTNRRQSDRAALEHPARKSGHSLSVIALAAFDPRWTLTPQ